MFAGDVTMKRIYCSLIVFSAFLTGCGVTNEIASYYPENSASQTITSQNKKSEYNSYVVFEIEGDTENEDIDNAVNIIKNRVTESCPNLNYNISLDYDSKIFRLDFDRTEKWSELFIENLILRNSVELRKGDSISDPIVIDKENIADAESYFAFAEDYANWCVLVEFDEKGSSLFADVTSELAGTDIPISIWVNDELVFAPLVSCAITDGRTVITGNFTEQSAEELAEKIQSEFLPYSVSINEYKLAENYT